MLKRSLTLAVLSSLSLPLVGGCASLMPHQEADANPPIITGAWQGELFLPKDMETVRGADDRACDRGKDPGMHLAIARNADQVKVEAHFQCKVQGREVSMRDIPTTTYQLKGEDLLQDGRVVGKATAMYFSLNTADGTLRVVKYPTWEQVSYQLSKAGPPPVIMAAHFEDSGTWSEEVPGQPVSRLPASGAN